MSLYLWVAIVRVKSTWQRVQGSPRKCPKNFLALVQVACKPIKGGLQFIKRVKPKVKVQFGVNLLNIAPGRQVLIVK